MTTLPTERCGSHVQNDFDPGLESRTVIAGPVAMVTFRASPVAESTPPARSAFKLAVRLDSKVVATLRTKTPGTWLVFNREAALRDDIYRLIGAKRVRISGCSDQTALFVGAVLTTGPTRLDVDVLVKGRRTPVTLTAFEG